MEDDPEGWLDLEVLPEDGQPVLFKCRNGSLFVAPAVPDLPPMTRAERLAAYKAIGRIPSREYDRVAWKPLPGSALRTMGLA